MSERKTPWTEGPWETFPARPRHDDRIGVQSRRSGLLVADCGLAGNTHSLGNAELIAKAPEMAGLLKRLTTTANLLHQNCVGCAINHHSLDFAQQGLPGWLADAEREIAEARSLLAALSQEDK